jgi:hypothetical protein
LDAVPAADLGEVGRSCSSCVVCLWEGEKAAWGKGRRHWREVTRTNERFWLRGFERRVELVEMQGVGHLVPMEAPRNCTELIWIEEEIKGWWKEWDRNRRWRQMRKEEKDIAVESWMTGLKRV